MDTLRGRTVTQCSLRLDDSVVVVGVVLHLPRDLLGVPRHRALCVLVTALVVGVLVCHLLLVVGTFGVLLWHRASGGWGGGVPGRLGVPTNKVASEED
eukprot:gene714-biopygen7345